MRATTRKQGASLRKARESFDDDTEADFANYVSAERMDGEAQGLRTAHAYVLEKSSDYFKAGRDELANHLREVAMTLLQMANVKFGERSAHMKDCGISGMDEPNDE